MRLPVPRFGRLIGGVRDHVYGPERFRGMAAESGDAEAEVRALVARGGEAVRITGW